MASKFLQLLTAKAATGAGASFHITVPEGKENVPVAIYGTFVGTVSIDGSIDGTNWVSLISKTAAFTGVVPALPYLRGNVTAYTSGAINVQVFANQQFGN